MRDLMVLKTNWSRKLAIRMDNTIRWSDGKRRNEEFPFDIRNSSGNMYRKGCFQQWEERQ
jgi:hypothetical protein